MRLIKSAINSKCALNRKGLGIEGGAIYHVQYPAIGGTKIAKIATEEYTTDSGIARVWQSVALATPTFL